MRTPIFALAALFTGTAAASGGFTGPSDVRAVTVAEVAALPDDTPVRLTGQILRSLGDEEYEFDDGTGTLTVEIDEEAWQGVEAGPDVRLELTGEVDHDGNRVELDVDRLRLSQQ